MTYEKSERAAEVHGASRGSATQPNWALDDQNEYLRTILDTVQAALLITDTDESVVFANRNALEMLGYTLEELQELDPEALIHPDEREAIAERKRSRLQGVEVESRFRRRLVRKDDSTVWVEGTPSSLWNDGKIVGRIAEYREITGQVEAERLLQEGLARLELAQSMAHVGSSERSTVEGGDYWSDEMYRLLGYEPSSTPPPAAHCLKHLHPEDREQFELEFRDYRDGIEDTYDAQARFIGADGVERVLAVHGERIRDEDGSTLRLVGTAHDVTELAHVQTSLAERMAELNLAQSRAHVGSWRRSLIDSSGYWSDEMYRLFGLDPTVSSPLLTRYLEYLHPEDRVRYELELRDFREELVDSCDASARFVGADGVQRVLSMHIERTRGVDGGPLQVDGTAQDVTELVRSQESLAESTRHLELAQRQARIGSFSRNLITGEVYWSDELYRLHGYEPAEIEPRTANPFGRIHPDDQVRFMETIERAIKSGADHYDIQSRYTSVSGEEQVLWRYGELTRNADGEPLRWDGTIQDVTALDALRQELIEREEFLSTTLEAVRSGVMVVDSARQIISANRNASQIMGYDRDEFIGVQLEDVIRGDDLALMLARFGARLRGESGPEHTIIRASRKDGSEIDLDVRGAPVTSSGTLNAIVVDFRDVTEELLVRGRLEETAERLDTIVETVSTGLVIVGSDRQIISVNQAICDITGYSREELMAGSFERFLHPDEVTAVLGRFARRLTGERDEPSDYRSRMIRKDGVVADVNVISEPLRIDGQFLGILAEVRDITEELSLQALVVEGAEQINTILEATPDAIVVADEDDVILRVNAAAESIFGRTPDQLIGHPVSTLVGGVEREAHGAYVEHYVRTGAPSTDERLVIGRFREAVGSRADDSEFPAEIAVAEAELADGRRLFVAAIRDITDRKQAEQQLQQLNTELEARMSERQALVQQLLAAQEEERRTVAYELHDGPAQQLAAAQMFMEAFIHDAAITEEDESTTNLHRAKQQLEAGLTETRRIMSGLRPALLDDLGLVDALRQLLSELVGRLDVELEFDGSELADQLSPAVEITLYRIAQEATSNALTHSGSDRLSVQLSSDGLLVGLQVRDWGRGFDPAEAPKPHEGRHFGLVGMRERVELLEGTFTIDSHPGQGTVIAIAIPLGTGHS